MNAVGYLGSLGSFINGEPLLARLFLGSIELTLVAALVWAVIRVGLVRSPRYQSVLWWLVSVKALVVLAVGAVIPVVNLEASTISVPVAKTVQQPAMAGHAQTVPSALPLPATPLHAEKNAGKLTHVWGAIKHIGLTRWIMAGWLAGVALCLLHIWVDRLRLHRLVAVATLASTGLSDRCTLLSEQLGVKRMPELRVTEDLESPAIVGFLSPVILIPKWLTQEKWVSKLDWALRHELMHWRLLDPMANAIRLVAQAFFFFHPVIWFAGKKWQESTELACDRALVNSEAEVEEYANNLYEVLVEIHTQRQRQYLGGLFASRTQVGSRISSLLYNRLGQRAKLGLKGAALLGLVAVIMLGFGGSMAAAKVDGTQDPKIDAAIEKLSTTSNMDAAAVQGVMDSVKSVPENAALFSLAQWLQSDVATKRRSAIYILGELPWKDPSPIFPELRKLMSNGEDYTRGMAALSLGSLQDASSYDAIVKMAKEDKSPYTRRCAAFALGEFADLKALEPLQSIAKDADNMVQQNANNATERLTFLKDNAGMPENAQKAVQAIWLIAGSEITNQERLNRAMAMLRETEPAAREQVLKKASENSSQAIKNSAAYATKCLNEKAPETASPQKGAEAPEKVIDAAIEKIAVTADMKPEPLKALIESVKSVPEKEAIPVLAKWLKSNDATKRRSAIYLFDQYQWNDPSPIIPDLRALLSNDEDYTRGMAAASLGSLQDAASFDAIVKMAKEDKSPYARRCAALTLGEYGDEKALEPLQLAAKDSDYLVQQNANNAIERLTFLKENAGMPENAQKAVRAIWIIAGGESINTERFELAMNMLRETEPAAREQVLKKAAESNSQAIKASAEYVTKALTEKTPEAAPKK